MDIYGILKLGSRRSCINFYNGEQETLLFHSHFLQQTNSMIAFSMKD